MERRFRFEEYNNNLISDIETACELRMIPSADKVEAVKHTADVVSILVNYTSKNTAGHL